MNEAQTERKFKLLTEQANKGYKAFLYDCDGTLANNMEAHKQSYIKVAADHGLTLQPEIIDEFAGLPIPRVVEEINKRYNTTLDPVTFAELKSELFHNEYIDRTEPIEFVVEHLKANAGKVKIGVVSGGSRRSIEKTLTVLDILQYVEVLVCAGETAHGKPYPDPFLAAAEKLGVKPEECVVFEDGDAGVKAAEAAGMKWIRIDKIG